MTDAETTPAEGAELDWWDGPPRAKLTADLVPFALNPAGQVCVLLIRRDPDDETDPYAGMWATLGGGMDPRETFAQTAVREGREEGGVDVEPDALHLVGVFDDPDRDRRGRVISVAYTLLLPEPTTAYRFTAGNDAVEVAWVPVDAAGRVPGVELAFDHGDVVAAAWRVMVHGRF